MTFKLNVLALAIFGQTACSQAPSTKAKTQALFDGKTIAGWHTYLKPTAEPAWEVVDGALQLNPKAPGQGDLVTDGEYENYELNLEWKISPEGNSGIIFGVHEDPAFAATYETGIEMQVLDNKGAEDNKKATHLAGSLYDMQAPAKDVAKPAGEWNRVKLRKDNGHLTFFLNNTKIVDVQMGSPAWDALLANSKFKTWKNFGAYPKGHIALQDHGHEVAFRAITITQL
ncbi:glycosyl hydrolase [Hymenobacter coccineus]|uniref:Glycosyl hydrolase n=2 Tax=Hymenobacter coccineus TaxID=1908235 RepID=A0A1G1SR13_9BACT|nr:glycosyl hydrolase [Hymenobacter coccineus]